MTITIPVWLLWTIGVAVGIPLLVVVLMFAWIGYVFVSSYRPPQW